MKPKDFEHYQANYRWFNQFFQDAKHLLDLIAESLSNEHNYQNATFYYSKWNYQPTIPPYLIMGMNNEEEAFQSYMVFDPEMPANNEYFHAEPSLIFVRFPESSKLLSIKDYGESVIRNNNIEDITLSDGVVVGKFTRHNHLPFQAFQVPLSAFSTDTKTMDVIQTEIVDRVLNLPGFDSA